MRHYRQSSIRSFMRCPRQYRLSQEWELTEPSRALLMGTAMDTALGAWWGLGPGAEPKERLQAAQTAWEAAKCPLCPADQVMGEILLVGYTARWGYHESTKDVVEVQSIIVRPLLGLDGEESNLDVRGTLDLSGPSWAADHKTTGQELNRESYWTRLEYDLQIPAYFILREDEGRPIEFMLWDVIRTPRWQPEQATPKDKQEFYKRDGKYGKKGDPKPGTFLRDETMPEFRQRFAKEVAGNPEAFFQRRKLSRTEADLEKIRYDLYGHARLIEMCEEADIWPRSIGESTCLAYGRKCDFYDVCHNSLDPSTSPSYKKREE